MSSEPTQIELTEGEWRLYRCPIRGCSAEHYHRRLVEGLIADRLRAVEDALERCKARQSEAAQEAQRMRARYEAEFQRAVRVEALLGTGECIPATVLRDALGGDDA